MSRTVLTGKFLTLLRSTKSLGALGATGRDAAAWVTVLSGSGRNAGQPMAWRKRACGLGVLLMTGKPLADGTAGEPDSSDGPLEVMPLLPLPPPPICPSPSPPPPLA